MSSINTHREQRLGFIYGVLSYLIWGFFPLYFYLLKTIMPWQVLMHRVIWSFLLVSAIALLLKRWQPVKEALCNPNILKPLAISSVLISANWLIFIWAVGQQRVLESSLGYFLTPLISVTLARIFLQEKMDTYRLLAVLLACIGVAWQVIHMGQLPWISLALAGSFGFYGLVRKKAPVDALTGLIIETGFLLPFALLYWLWLIAQGENQFSFNTPFTTFLLIASGAVTAIPLLTFAAGAKRLSLTAIGFIMYINPTMQFLTATLIFKEPFNSTQLVSFGFIWAALTVFSLGAVRQYKKPIVKLAKA